MLDSKQRNQIPLLTLEQIINQNFVSLGGSGGNVDNTAPTISNCPSAVRVTAPSGQNSATASWPLPSAVDDSGIVPSVTSDRDPGDAFSVGTTTVTYTFTDGAGNEAICTFDVIVVAGELCFLNNFSITYRHTLTLIPKPQP